MGVLSRLWVAMRTQDKTDAGTDDPVVLIINENGVDKLHHTFPDTPQDQAKGQANLYDIDLKGRDIRSGNLSNSSIRMAIRGSDFWHPQHVLVWAQEADGGQVIPLAAEWDIKKGISTDASEGNLSFPLRRIGFPTSSPVTGVPDTNARIRQILVVLTTADVSEAGTDNEIDLEITFGGGTKWNQLAVPEKSLKQGKAFFLLPTTVQFPPPGAVPRRNNLDSVVLRISNDDSWLPSSFFLFGFQHTFAEPLPGVSPGPPPDSIMPLIHIPNWKFGPLSTDRNEGKESVPLPLLPPPQISADPFDVT
jgi:hypothetical protein